MAADGRRAGALAAALGAEFHATFWDGARYDTGTMAASVLPLALGA
eukprot:gene53645-502_t